MRQAVRFLRDFPASFVPIIGAKAQEIGMDRKLDRFDIVLLNLLQADNLATAEARHVPISPSGIDHRIRGRREDGLTDAKFALLAAPSRPTGSAPSSRRRSANMPRKAHRRAFRPPDGRGLRNFRPESRGPRKGT